MASARVHIPDDLSGLLQSEWERVIREAGYSRQDAEIVRRYIVGKSPQIDVAVELCMERSTLSRRLPGIYTRARQTAKRLDMIEQTPVSNLGTGVLLIYQQDIPRSIRGSARSVWCRGTSRWS